MLDYRMAMKEFVPPNKRYSFGTRNLRDGNLMEVRMGKPFVTAFASAAIIFALTIGPALAKHDDDDHDNGRHRGWYKHHDHEEGYEAPGPVVIYPAPPPVVVYPQPAPVYVAPVPVAIPPSVNFVFPLRFK
jgi:hypothetical protein